MEMSRASSSLNLSEFFSNDDSQGNRLADFLQNRHGGVRKQNFLFMNCAPQRLSVNVQLEKLCNTQNKSTSEGNKEDKQNIINTTVSKETVKSVKNGNDAQQLQIGEMCSEPNDRLKCNELQSQDEPLLPGGGVSAISMGRPEHPNSPSSAMRNVSPVVTRKDRLLFRQIDGVVSLSDKLRRYSLKRLSKLGGGRRTLLQEFENTISDTNFYPTVCSTPLSKLCGTKSLSPINSNKTLPNNFERECVPKTFLHKDEELNGMKNILEKTLQTHVQKETKEIASDETLNSASHANKSPLKRTYTIEKGDVGGQILLTPADDMNNQTLPSKELLLQEKTNNSRNNSGQPHNNTSLNKDRRSTLFIEIDGCRCSKTREISRSKAVRSTTAFHSASNNLKNDPIVSPSRNTFTQEKAKGKESSTLIQSDKGSTAVVVIPISQIINASCSKELHNKTKENTQLTCPNVRTIAVGGTEEDNLKLRDILTEDEEDTSSTHQKQSVANITTDPLNLASKPVKIKLKRLRKRSLLRQMRKSQSQIIEKEFEPLNKNNTKGCIAKRKQIPLNRAPGFPLNGEIFANELKRMSNFEILDLRKRNSMGKIFTTSSRNSIALKEEALRKQNQLDEEIEMELITRNIEKISAKKISDIGVHNMQSEIDESERLPVPTEFRDSMNDKAQHFNRDSSLVGEKPMDRISFTRQNARKPLKLSEELKQYLEVTKSISQKKKKSSINKSKRLLYTQGNFDLEEADCSIQQANINKSSLRSTTSSMPHNQSYPNPSGELNTNPEVVSSPPKLQKNVAIHRIRRNGKNVSVDADYNETLPPPPTGFDNDSGVSSNNFDNHSNLDSTLKKGKKHVNSNIHDKHKTDLEEHIFKIPNVPPKTKTRKRNLGKTASENSEPCTPNYQNTTDYGIDSSNSTLRRSKRTPVPVSYPIVDFLVQRAFGQRLQSYNNKQQKEKSKREVSKTTRQSKKSKSMESVSASVSKSVRRNRKVKQLPAPSGNDVTHQAFSRKNVAKNPGSKGLTEQEPKTKKTTKSKENSECSRFILATPPPVHHLNNMFDKLSNTRTTAKATSQNAPALEPVPPPLKVKPLKVRLPRLKFSSVPTTNFNSLETLPSDTSKNSNNELISWLRNITNVNNSLSSNSEIFRDMRITTFSNMCFAKVQGVEYAFYDTDDKGSLGYLRFRPHQFKPKKKARRFQLHFIVLMGNFRITINGSESLLRVGDMAAIEKSVYYDIENLSDDIGILMVIKK